MKIKKEEKICTREEEVTDEEVQLRKYILRKSIKKNKRKRKVGEKVQRWRKRG